MRRSLATHTQLEQAPTWMLLTNTSVRHCSYRGPTEIMRFFERRGCTVSSARLHDAIPCGSDATARCARSKRPPPVSGEAKDGRDLSEIARIAFPRGVVLRRGNSSAPRRPRSRSRPRHWLDPLKRPWPAHEITHWVRRESRRSGSAGKLPDGGHRGRWQ